MLLSIALCASFGDTFLSQGMKEVGEITIHRLPRLFLAPVSNWHVGLGVILLIGFFASYLTALSWADLTFVLPSTAIGYVVLAILSRFYLHEDVSVKRWIGIVLIVIGTGFVAGGPSLTESTIGERVG